MGRFGNVNLFSDYEVHNNQDWGMGRLMDSQEVFLNGSKTMSHVERVKRISSALFC